MFNTLESALHLCHQHKEIPEISVVKLEILPRIERVVKTPNLGFVNLEILPRIERDTLTCRSLQSSNLMILTTMSYIRISNTKRIGKVF